jgi:hypothetical protein
VSLVWAPPHRGTSPSSCRMAASLLPCAPPPVLCVGSTGDIGVLAQCKSLQDAIFYNCDKLTGKRAALAWGGGGLTPPTKSWRALGFKPCFWGLWVGLGSP